MNYLYLFYQASHQLNPALAVGRFCAVRRYRCRVATRGVRSDIFVSEIADPERTYKKIFDLKDDTEYEITIWALTAAGKGQPKVIVEVTVPSSGRRRSSLSCAPSRENLAFYC